MRKTFGILAHVDAGKTTFSEQVLYIGNAIRTVGRVDHKDAFLDCHEIERQRGITVYSDQAYFQYNGSEYYLMDTPGHADFSAEMERTLEVLDYAVLLVSGTQGIQGHTITIWNLLRKKHVPTFLFINKMDVESADLKYIIEQLYKKLSVDILYLKEEAFREKISVELKESIAERDDELLQQYFDGSLTDDALLESLRQMIKEEKIFPVMAGSALKNNGICEFFEQFDLLTVTDYESKADEDFQAKVYKVGHDKNGERLCFLKVLSGRLSARDDVRVSGREQIRFEKVNQIKKVQGSRLAAAECIEAGELAAVTGLNEVRSQQGIGALEEQNKMDCHPALKAQVIYPDHISDQEAVRVFRLLEEEDPMLAVTWNGTLRQLEISVMGIIQLEVLKHEVMERFHFEPEFLKPKVLYQETIRKSCLGYGHFEPLRHYAEVAVRLEPLENGSGIEFASECPVDALSINFQNLIETHVFEKVHKGVLLGAPLTDVRIVLVNGISHIKHTEGGDFREATYRAIRQALEKAESVILEPVYSFDIETEINLIGRVLSDITKMHGCFGEPLSDENVVTVKGSCPVADMMNYSSEFMSYTKGKGKLSLEFTGYEECKTPYAVIEETGYEKEHDLENVSSSVFCSKGTAFTVKWNEAEKYMHSLHK